MRLEPRWFHEDIATCKEATQILTAMVLSVPNYALVPPELLEWYLRRRRLDLKSVEHNEIEAHEIRQDIVVLEAILKAALE